MARLITTDRQARMPWRNGGGETREVAAWPPGATLDAFAWRVSVATIAHSGPFSRFPGVMRTLVLLSGTGVRLHGETTRIELTRWLSVATLRGDEHVDCKLMGSSVQMFNVMVRSRAPARVVVADGKQAVPLARFRICYAVRGRVACEAAGTRVEVEEAQALVLDEGESREALTVAPVTPGAVAVAARIDTAGTA